LTSPSHEKPENGSASAVCGDLCRKKKCVFALLVAAQFLIVIIMMFTLRSSGRSFLSVGIQVSGVALGLWAIVSMGRGNIHVSPELRHNAQLVTRGPYQFVRHPMYSALLLFTGSYVLSDRSAYSLQLWIGLAIVLGCKVMYEEAMLKNAFPDYVNYAKRTKRVIPFLF